MVVLSHYYPLIGLTFSDGLISFSRNIGTLGVGIFFLLSGYATMISKINKRNYLHHYLFKRALRLYVPFLIVFFVYFILECAFKGQIIVRYLFVMPIMSLPDTPNWYLKVQFCLYVLFFVFAKIFKKNSFVIIAISTSCILYMIIGFLLKLDGFWYNTIFAFPLGMFVAIKKNDLYTLLRKRIVITISASTILLLVCLFPFFMWGGTIFEMIFVFGFVQFIVCICSCFCGDMKIIKYLGKCSLEIYLSHMVMIFVFKQLFDLKELNVVWNLVLLAVFLTASVLMSMAVRFISNKIIKRVLLRLDNKKTNKV